VQMPNLTQAQVVAFVSVLATVLAVVFKLNLTDEQQAVIAGAIVAIYALGHLIADAVIRHGRASAMASIHVANAQIAQATGIDALPDPDV